MNTIIETNKTKLLAAMPDVKGYEARLASLNDWWGKIALIGKINSHNVASTILDDMNLTKGKFGELQQKLTNNLVVENLKKLVLDNSSKAQVAIDLLIRNLFERTADVGFWPPTMIFVLFLQVTTRVRNGSILSKIDCVNM